MCTGIGVALLVGGLAAGGSILRGFGNARASRMQAEIARRNAALIMAGARVRQRALRRVVERTIGGQVAYYAANNLDPTVGAPLLAIAESAGAGELDRKLIEMDASNQAAQQQLQARELDRQARFDILGGFFGAGTAFLQGFTGAGGSFGGGGAGIFGGGG